MSTEEIVNEYIKSFNDDDYVEFDGIKEIKKYIILDIKSDKRFNSIMKQKFINLRINKCQQK
jgi:hypothetical protein